jgi:hypothetical protein
MVAIPGFLSSILGFLSSVFGISQRRQQQSASEQHLDDVGAIMDDNYYKRDIVIAGKKMSLSPYPREQINAVRDIGHIAWLGGPAVATFASSHLMEFCRILLDDDTPVELKKQTLYAIIEVCVGTMENQEKARWNGLLETLYTLLDCRVLALRRGATACLAVLVNENYANHVAVLHMKNMKEKLLIILQDDWRAWKRNEAARLIVMLGLNRVDENGTTSSGKV